MTNLTAHRFTLQLYAGPKSRTTCPGCSKPRCFTHYLDTDTGELLPDEYGRCDHEGSCGYNRNPYHKPAGGGPSYATATERGERPSTSPRPMRRLPAAPVAVVSIPTELFTASLRHYDRNNAARLLGQHFGAGVTRDLLTRFQVGTSAHWPGACVFWFIDEQGRVRGGKIMLYDETFHRIKSKHPTWVHIALTEKCHRLHKQPPTWLADYQAHGQKSSCLFGLPQLATSPTEQPVALVESEKTAILAPPYIPRYIWMATGSKSQLTPDRLEPLRGRQLMLFPDAGALGAWQAKAEELRQLGFDIAVSDEMEKIAAENPSLAGGDLADVLLNEWPGYPPNWEAEQLA